MLTKPELPVEIVIAEAFEIARRFGTAEPSEFVDGVLAPRAQRVRRTSAANWRSVAQVKSIEIDTT